MYDYHPGFIGRGLIAGLVATVALSVVLLLKQAAGVMPQLDLVLALAQALGYHTPAAGWLANYVVGVILWGALFPWADRKSSFPHWFNGLLFASAVWLGVMLVVLPMAGAGLFGISLGLATPTLTLFLHWIYGVVLGTTYGVLSEPAAWGRARARLHRLRHA